MWKSEMDPDENEDSLFGEKWRIPFGTAYTVWLRRLSAKRDPGRGR